MILLLSKMLVLKNAGKLATETALSVCIVVKALFQLTKAFTDPKRSGSDSLREQEFSKLAEKTRFDFKTQCINFMERHSARAVYLIRDHNPFHDKQNKYRKVYHRFCTNSKVLLEFSRKTLKKFDIEIRFSTLRQ